MSNRWLWVVAAIMVLAGCGGRASAPRAPRGIQRIQPAGLSGDVRSAQGPYLVGDMDGDGQASVGDAIRIARIIVGLGPDNPLADANLNGSTDVADAVKLCRCVVGLDAWPIYESTPDATAPPAVVSVAETTIGLAATGVVSLELTNASDVAGFQVALRYDPSVLELVREAAVRKGEAVPTGSHMVINASTPGMVMIAVFGTSRFDDSTNQILSIKFRTTGEVSTTTIDIDDTSQAPTPLGISNHVAAMMIPPPEATDGEVTIGFPLLGDLDGDRQATVGDAIGILRIVVGLADDSPLADANQNGTTEVGDAIKILRIVVGLDPWPIIVGSSHAHTDEETADTD